MTIWYLEENRGGYAIFPVEHSLFSPTWNGGDGGWRCNESVWLVPGTVEV